MTRRGVAILGSTGSVGTTALRVLDRQADRFAVVALTAGSNAALLHEQAARYHPAFVGLVDAGVGADDHHAGNGWRCGPECLTAAATRSDVDIVLNAVVGAAGLDATLAALEAGKRVALANKETLVMAGELAAAAARRGGGELVPVDSEPSAILQCIAGRPGSEIRRVVLTASGGPFRAWPRERVVRATVADALQHPTWSMGRKITIDSATLANKALEVIEAHFLFGLDYDRIEVVVHPQSVIHSMVEFVDGSTIAQASPPDMRLPIALALGWPDRVPHAAKPVDWTGSHEWTFQPLDEAAFPAVPLAKAAGRAGRCRPAIYNAANEECVAAFTAGRIPFTAIVETVERALAGAPDYAEPGTVEDVLAAESWARAHACELIAAAKSRGA